LKFLLTELADDKKRKMEDEVFRMWWGKQPCAESKWSI
jgi:hypothetical protein